MSKPVKLLKPKPNKSVMHNFRLSEAKSNAFQSRLKEVGMKKQDFIEQMIDALIDGKIS